MKYVLNSYRSRWKETDPRKRITIKNGKRQRQQRAHGERYCWRLLLHQFADIGDLRWRFGD